MLSKNLFRLRFEMVDEESQSLDSRNLYGFAVDLLCALSVLI